MYIMYLLVPTTLVLLVGTTTEIRAEPQCTQFDYNNQLLYKMVKVEEDVKRFHAAIKGVKKLREELKDEHRATLAATEDAIRALNVSAGAVLEEMKKHNREQETEQEAKLDAILEEFKTTAEETIEKIKEGMRQLKVDVMDETFKTRQKLINKPPFGFTVKGPRAAPSLPTHATFTTAVTNELGGYNTTTGVFTCTIPGTYFFSATLISLDRRTGKSCCYIYKNSEELVAVFSEPPGRKGGYVPAVNSVYVRLGVGDTVKLAGCTDIPSPPSLRSEYSSFTGFLVTSLW